MFKKNKTYTLEELQEIASSKEHDFVQTSGLIYVLTQKDTWTFKQVDSKWQ